MYLIFYKLKIQPHFVSARKQTSLQAKRNWVLKIIFLSVLHNVYYYTEYVYDDDEARKELTKT